MTDHKPLPVSGYVGQNDDKIALVNKNKELEERCLRVFDDLAKLPNTDKRWLAIGRTEIEKGWMAVNRSIFQPVRIRLPEDE